MEGFSRKVVSGLRRTGPRLTGASHPWKIMEWGQSLVAGSPNRDWLCTASFAVQGTICIDHRHSVLQEAE
jgi:hypothetical protein